MKKNSTPLTTLDSILAHTAALFYAKGFENVTFSDVAKKVGISQPALYAYVDHKMDLLQQVCLWSAAKGRDFIDAQLNPRSRALENLKLYVEANLNFFFEHKVDSHSVLALYYFGATSAPLRALYKATREAALNRLGTFLIQAQNENVLQRGCEKTVTQPLHTLLIGYCYRSIYAEDKSEQRVILKECWSHIEILLRDHRRE
jgi:AcrR family transcriptional regulator